MARATETSTGQAGSRQTVEYAALETLRINPQNARKHPKWQIKQLAACIQEFGVVSPIMVDAEGMVLSGHGRLLALKMLEHVEAPIIRACHLTPAQAQAYAIADNKTSDSSSFDKKILAENLQALSQIDLGFSIELTGFSVGEIDMIVQDLVLDSDEERGADPDDEALPDGPAVTRPGDLWLLGGHRLLCGDALSEADFERLMDDERAQVVFIDPPYNVRISGNVSAAGRHREFAMATGEMDRAEFVDFLTQALIMVRRYSAQGSVHYCCMDWRHVGSLLAAGQGVYDTLLNMCVWAKTNGGMGALYRSAHELVLVFRNGKAQHRNNVQMGRHGRNRTNVWRYPGANTFVRTSVDADLLAQHPTPKPARMVADALLDTSSPRDVVLDSFSGSGSTLIAAERTGRIFRGMDLDPLYVDLAVRRWIRRTGGQAVLESSGAAFAQLEADAGAAQ